MVAYLLRRIGASLVVALLAVLWPLCGAAAQGRGQVYYVVVDQGLTQPTVSVVRRALRDAQAANATALVIELRGGGSLPSAWPLARELAQARVPVVTYIAPRGAQSGPVGTLLTAASHVAAMAPGSSIGFAAPLVDVPAGFSSSTQQLVVDDTVKQLTAWARERGRNADWYAQAAREGAIIDAERAQSLQPPVVELVATEAELLVGLQGRRVILSNGEQRGLETLGASVRRVEPRVWEAVAHFLALPTVAFVLFVLGGIALYLELATPGLGIPGVTGAILVLAALTGFVLGEVRPLAVLLLAAGLVLVGLEHVVLSHGGLTIAGVLLLVLGAVFLVDPDRTPGLEVAPLAIGGVAVLLAGAALGLVGVAARVRSRRPVTGQEALVGQLAEVRRRVAPEGMVFVSGALWSAWTDGEAMEAGELVEVAAVDGLRLYVRRVQPE